MSNVRNERTDYYLCIHTNNFTGPYAKGLVGYATGIVSKDYERELDNPFVRAFWNSLEDSCINNYMEYLEFINIEKINPDISRKILANLDGVTPNADEKIIDEYADFYENMLAETSKIADWEVDISRGSSIYGIGKYYSNPTNVIDCIYIHLNKPIDKYMEILTNRISYFFRNNAFETIYKYSCICDGIDVDIDITQSLTADNLISIELINSSGELVKKYPLNRDIWRYVADGIWKKGEKVYGNGNTLVVGVDNNMGISFNKRRCSYDDAVVSRIFQISGGRPIVSSCSTDDESIYDYWEELFSKDDKEYICVSEVEDPSRFLNHFGEVVIFRWNRDYPSDVKFTADLSDYILVSTFEFRGYSHEKITEERYVRKETFE